MQAAGPGRRNHIYNEEKEIEMKRIKPGPALLVALALVFAMATGGNAAAQYTIQMVVGDVKVISGGKTTAAAVDRVLSAGDTIVTGKSSMADLCLGDRGLVRVQESSKVTVASLKKKADDPDVGLDSGSILVMLSKLVKGESYQVKTNTQVASVRGTNFQVTSDSDESRVDVLSGKILVNPVADGEVRKEIEEYVSENQSLSLNRGTIRDLIAKRRQMRAAAIQDRDFDTLLERFSKIRESRGFRKLNKDLQGDFQERIKKFRERRAQRREMRDNKRQEMRDRMQQRRNSNR
jgi:hypothetical protein